MSDRTERYLYRCSRDSLMESLKHIEESGDTIEWPINMGDSGFWLICRRATTEPVISLSHLRRLCEAADVLGPGLKS